ncbi:hypothetical protein J2W27_004381 [Variovorax boronicumulans]|uniref:hypothetical protein n=1 Tax=Variovorax boronicumulans TaxID=436515 RepID=UPI00277E3372|nr:hypothetical protein [Variovorax boronicumulans]MDP9912255.1 hypothetical protein [Variovorax boronicumulans]
MRLTMKARASPRLTNRLEPISGGVPGRHRPEALIPPQVARYLFQLERIYGVPLLLQAVRARADPKSGGHAGHDLNPHVDTVFLYSILGESTSF